MMFKQIMDYIDDFDKLTLNKIFGICSTTWVWLYDIFVQGKDFCSSGNRTKVQTLLLALFLLLLKWK